MMIDGIYFNTLVVVAATARGVTHLWLDVWAYRELPPWSEYNHEHFVRTLCTVMAQVDVVVWLPRSRERAPGEYHYRLWVRVSNDCTQDRAWHRRLEGALHSHRSSVGHEY